jgi:subtilisin family serine protease
MSRSILLAAAWALALAQIASAQPGNGSTAAEQQVGIPAATAPGYNGDRTVVLAEHSDAEFAPDEILLAFRPGVPVAHVEAVQLAVGATQIKQFPQIGVHHWRLPPGLTVDQAVEFLSAIPIVEYAEPNYILRTHVFPNDPFFSHSQWPLRNIGYLGGIPDADIDAPEAWNVQTGSADVVVAVIDSGIDYTHEDLADNIWVNPGEVLNGIDDDGNGYVDDVQGWDFRNNDNDPFDDYGHGTHVAGIIGAVGNNGIGIAGVNWTVTLMPLKFTDSAGDGWTDDAIEAIQYAASFGVRVTNNSWGGRKSHSLEIAIENAGALFVASAGNDGSTQKEYPAASSLDNIISVAATDKYDELASFSNYGDSWVDLGAPGVFVLSTVPIGDCSLCSPDGLLHVSGTSMAAPHVAGVAALLMAEDPAMDILTIKDRILAGVDPLPSLEGKTVTGGRLNAFNAVPRPPGIVVTPVGGRVTTEGGTTDSFSVVLYAEPAANVTIDLSSSDPSEGTVWPASLLFTPEDWELPKQVIVTGVDDAVGDGNVTYTVLTAPAVSADPEYDGLDANDVSVINLDDDGVRAQDGSIVAWGAGEDCEQHVHPHFGQSCVPEPNADFVAVAAGAYHTLGLQIDGSIVAWGAGGCGQAAAYDYGQTCVPEPNIDFVGVAAGTFHSLGVKSDGSIVTWGYNHAGQCDVPEPNTGFVAAAGGIDFSVGLKSNGSIVRWGADSYVPEPNTDFVAVAAGPYHILGLNADGSIVAWGAGDCEHVVAPFPHYGQSCVPEPNSDFVAVASGSYHSLGLKADGSIVAWGRNDHGQCDVPEPNSDFVAVAAGGDHSLGLNADGSIVPWGHNNRGQLVVPAPNTGFSAVAGGAYHSLGLVGLPPSPGITVTPTLGLVTTEGAGTDVFSVVLDTQPAADVTIDLSTSDPSEGTVSPAYLIFNAADWYLPQQVFVTGVDDAIIDGDIPYTIVTAPAVSADPDYDWLDADDVSVTNLDDDDWVGVTVSSIWPDWMNAGTTIDVTLTGAGFQWGAIVTFEDGAGPAPAGEVTFVWPDGSTIEATVTAHKNAKSAVWDVRVTNPDDSTAVLIDGFAVIR